MVGYTLHSSISVKGNTGCPIGWKVELKSFWVFNKCKTLWLKITFNFYKVHNYLEINIGPIIFIQTWNIFEVWLNMYLHHLLGVGFLLLRENVFIITLGYSSSSGYSSYIQDIEVTCQKRYIWPRFNTNIIIYLPRHPSLMCLIYPWGQGLWAREYWSTEHKQQNLGDWVVELSESEWDLFTMKVCTD